MNEIKSCYTCDNKGSTPGPCGWAMDICNLDGGIIGVEVPDDYAEDCKKYKERGSDYV